MENNELEKRMYSLNMYNISPIQAGIQSAHSNMEYMNEFYNDVDFQDWAKKWKTVILLNGGTSNSGKESHYGYAPAKGSMELHLETLLNYGIKVVPFYEPDMNYCLTSMSFLVDERVFNEEKYPQPDISSELLFILLRGSIEEILNYDFDKSDDKKYKDWIESIGGKKNLFLRLYLKELKLASN